MKKQIKKILPRAVYCAMSRIYRSWKYRNELRLLTRMQHQADVAEKKLRSRKPDYVLSRILIVPSDPHTLIGALGDEAMIFTTIAIARSRNPAVEVDIIVDGVAAKIAAINRNLGPIDIWSHFNYPSALVRCLNTGNYDAVIAVGADSVDGCHSPYHSARILKAADLAARSGIAAIILGFSVSESMSPAIAKLFDSVDGRLQINIRDEISYDRFKARTKARARLVADSAFLYEPGVVDENIAIWVERNRSAGRKVIGINIHPALISGRENYAEAIDSMNSKVSESLIILADRYNVSWLLLPHDYRQDVGDDICLRPIMRRIATRLDYRAYHLEGRRAAHELKAVAGLLDGVVTGRMHLAIGALGMGTPTMSLTYADKFEGLYRHFGLPEWLVLQPSEVLKERAFEDALGRFIEELPQVKETVTRHLPGVMKKSGANFSGL